MDVHRAFGKIGKVHPATSLFTRDSHWPLGPREADDISMHFADLVATEKGSFHAGLTLWSMAEVRLVQEAFAETWVAWLSVQGTSWETLLSG